MSDTYCSMIHGGLTLNFKTKTTLAGHCCLRYPMFTVDTTVNFWKDPQFEPLRQLNMSNKWSPDCDNCHLLENAGETSFRNGMNQGLGILGQTQLSGPSRIDLLFDTGCNLACRTCGPHSSTFWAKQLGIKPTISRSGQDVISALSNLDLSNLKQIVFCGGETLLGQEYWAITKWLSENVPNAKQQLTVGFQTNGTQPILPQNYKIIENLHLVKLHISIDGTKERFEYLRWPANWKNTTENILKIRNDAPSNVMFVVEETVSIFNALYLSETSEWVQEYLPTNRDLDKTNHTKHIAMGRYSLDFLTQEYVDRLLLSKHKNLIPKKWTENADEIQKMLSTIQHYDQQRNQSFAKTFPEVAECYRRFI